MNEITFSAPGIEEDYVLWLGHQIELIRERQFVQLDIENLLDELESLVKKRKKELRSRLRFLIWHLLKWEYQPNLRSKSWISTIATQREAIEDELDESPSLKPMLLSFAETEYRRSVRRAILETGLPKATFPVELPYTEKQLLDFDYLP